MEDAPAAAPQAIDPTELAARAWALRFTDPPAAKALAEQARCAADRRGDRRALALALRALGAARVRLLEHEQALPELEQAAAILEELGDEPARAGALGWVGHARLRRAEYGPAMQTLLAALQMHRAHGDREGESDALTRLGSVYFQLGDYARALEHFHAALQIHEALSDRFRIGVSLNNIGNIHGRRGEFQDALRYHTEYLRLARELGNRRGEALALDNIGSSYDLLGEFGPALEHYLAALEMGRSLGDRGLQADVLRNVGDVYRKLGRHDQAHAYYQEGLALCRALRLRALEAETLISIGITRGEKDDTAGARAALDEAVALAEEIGVRRLVYEAHRALAEVSEKAGDAAAALRHLKAYQAVKDVVFNVEADRRIQMILVQAEIERTHREAEALRSRNQELTTANDEKARLLEQLRLQAEELDRLSKQDALTGLRNRREADARLALEFERARRFHRDLTVVLADVDHFKEVNDRCSHAVGDAVLREIARLLREGTRRVDVVGRYGGEEFVLLLVETPPERALPFCDKLRAAVERHDWAAIHPELRVTVSMGLCGDVSLGSPEAMLAAADARLYAAKRAGRNRVCAE